MTNDLITGIFLGIATTFLIHVVLNKNLFLFTRNVFKPNVLMYLEEETGNYYVSVKNFCSFLNFFRLKSKLDEIPENEHAVLDFSLCSFVDHTVMEGLNEYRRGLLEKEGRLRLSGWMHIRQTQHPFAIRKSLPANDFFKINNNLTKRQLSLQKLSTVLGWGYRSEASSDTKELERFDFFKAKIINYQFNEIVNESGDFHLFDLSYSEGAFISKDNIVSSFLLINLKFDIPVFILDRENLLGGINENTVYKDLDFPKHPDFSKRFFLGGKKASEIRGLFDSKLIFFFESHAYFRVESIGKSLLIKGKNRLSSIQEIKQLLAFSTELMSIINNKYLDK